MSKVNTIAPADQGIGNPHYTRVAPVAYASFSLPDQSFTSPCCRNWEKSGWIKVKRREAETTAPPLDFNFRWNNGSAPLAEIWAVKGQNASMLSPKVASARFKYNRNNVTVPILVTVVARLSIESTLNVIVEHADGTGESIPQGRGLVQGRVVWKHNQFCCVISGK